VLRLRARRFSDLLRMRAQWCKYEILLKESRQWLPPTRSPRCCSHHDSRALAVAGDSVFSHFFQRFHQPPFNQGIQLLMA